jgi:hypothetical protein
MVLLGNEGFLAVIRLGELFSDCSSDSLTRCTGSCLWQTLPAVGKALQVDALLRVSLALFPQMLLIILKPLEALINK